VRGLLATALLAATVAASASGARTTSVKVPLPKLVGQSIVTGFAGTTPSAALLGRVRRGEVGGVILFRGNVGSPDAVRALVALLQKEAAKGGNPRLLVAVDQEGGPVRRLPDGPPAASAAAMGLLDLPSVRREGLLTGEYLRALGINVDLAPVADVPGSRRSFLGRRAFGRQPGRVAALASSFAAGLQEAGVAATAKHFPGLGTAPANTDEERVVVTSSREVLEGRLLPFRRLVDEGVQMVMVSNAAFPELDPTGAPALFSRALVTDLLRRDLRFDGVVVTDAMETPAPESRADAPIQAIGAGADVLLYLSEPGSRRAFAQLLAAARADRGLRMQLEAASKRIAELKSHLGKP
jgi:beta-N-acetylhexosaminidase